MRGSNRVLAPRGAPIRVGASSDGAPEETHPIRNTLITVGVTLVAAYFLFPIAKASLFARLAHEKAMLAI